MIAPARIKFNLFLTSERRRLLNEIPDLTFADDYSDTEKYNSQMLAISPNYANRALACRFNAKILAALMPLDKKDFRELTQDGKICVVGDLPKEQWFDWALRYQNFIWDRPWIAEGRQHIRLKTLLDRAVILPEFPGEVQIQPLRSVAAEGIGFSYSTKDFLTIEAFPALAEIFSLAKDIRVYDSSTYPRLGSAVEEALKEGKENFAGIFLTKPTLVLGYGWAPFDLIDLLAHEYAHVLHAENQQTLRNDGDRVSFVRDAVWHEAVAEAFAWNATKPLVKKFPEIRLFHVLKLKTLARLHPEDPHYVGAAALAADFHSAHEFSRTQLARLITAPNFQDYLEENQILTLHYNGKDPDEILRFHTP